MGRTLEFWSREYETSPIADSQYRTANVDDTINRDLERLCIFTGNTMLQTGDKEKIFSQNYQWVHGNGPISYIEISGMQEGPADYEKTIQIKTMPEAALPEDLLSLLRSKGYKKEDHDE